MTKAVISGYYGFKNFGDEAILSVLVDYLKSRGIESTVITFDPEFTHKKNNVNTVQTFDISNILHTLKDADILISGGGSLLQDVTSLKSLLYYSLIISLAQILKKKTIIFAQGIGPLNSKLSQIIVRKLLKSCDMVTVRDKNSLKLLNSWDIKATEVCDPIFSVEIPKPQKRNVVTVQLRDFSTLTDDFLDILADNIINNYQNKEIEILSLQDNIDLPICEKFNTLLKSKAKNITSKVVANCDNEKIIQKISSSETLIAMRFHALLIAIKSSTKTLAINYDIKVEKLANDYNLPILSLDCTDMQTQFEKLQSQNTQITTKKVNDNKFDWSIFDSILKY